MEAESPLAGLRSPTGSLRDLDPPYGPELQQRCLEIRQTGIGANGEPVLFNRKRRKSAQPRQSRQPITDEHADLIESLKSLGLAATAEEVQTALGQLYPDGWAEVERGEVIRRLFLQLRGKK